MKNSYKTSFRDLRQEGFQEMFESLERALQLLDIDFYLIGALARDTWLTQKGARALGTKDVDFAVLVANEQKYIELREFLIKREGFSDSGNEYVLFDKRGNQIDLLPFGAVEIEGNKLVDHTGLIHTDVSGFKEVYESATREVNFDDKFRFKVSTLTGIVVLKFIAYDDRPEIRSNDIRDIGIIIKHYFELEADMIYEYHADLFSGEEKSLEQIAARVLGRQMQPVLDKNVLLKQRILTILQINTASLNQSNIGLLLLKAGLPTIEDAIVLLKEILAGIEEDYQSL